MEVTTLPSVLAERVKILVVGEGLSGLAAAKALAAVSPVLGAGSTFADCGKSILNESSAAEEFGEESESLGEFADMAEDTFDASKLSVFHRGQLGYLNLPRCTIANDIGWVPKLKGLSSLLRLDLLVREGIHDAVLGWRKKISATGNKMTVEPSSKGGFDIEIGSYTVHVPKYSSVRHPLVQMMLFARTLYDSTSRCLNFVGPKSMVEFKDSGLLITKAKSQPPNTVSARKDVHVLADTAPEYHSITPGMDKKIHKLGELDYNVDMSTVPVHSGGFALENTYNLHSLNSAPNSADHGITKAEDKAEVWRSVNTAKTQENTEVTWLMATAAVHHATGTRHLLSGFTTIKDLFVKAGDGVSMPVCGRGSVITGTVVLEDVWFVPGLTDNLVSVTQLTDLDYSVGFARGACIIKSATDGVVIGKAHATEDGLFKVEFLNVQPVIAGE